MENIFTKLSNIAEGFRNHLFPPEELKYVIEQTSETRLEICKTCEHYSTEGLYKHCEKCGCSFPAKTKCLSCSCPVGKWQPLITKEEEDKLKKKI